MQLLCGPRRIVQSFDIPPHVYFGIRSTESLTKLLSIAQNARIQSKVGLSGFGYWMSYLLLHHAFSFAASVSYNRERSEQH